MSYPYGPVPRPHENSGAHIVWAWIATVFTGMYMLPWAIAATRHKENTVTIALLNLFLGWSGVGWIVCLVMACLADPVRPVVGYGYQPPTAVPGPYAQAPYAQAPYANGAYAYGPYAQPSAPRALEPSPEFPPYQPPPSPFPQQARPGHPYAFGMNSTDPYSTYPEVALEPTTVEGTVEDGRRR